MEIGRVVEYEKIKKGNRYRSVLKIEDMGGWGLYTLYITNMS